MPTPIDFVFASVLAIAWPLYDYFIEWPRLQRLARKDPLRARPRAYASIIAGQWSLVAGVAALWLWFARPWTALGLVAPPGWRLWLTIALLTLLARLYAVQPRALARMPEAKARVRKAAGPLELLLPHTTTEFRWFVAVAITAGVCEELLYRGYFIWTLAPMLGWWGAAAIGSACFGLLHAYQGRGGIVRTGLVGVAMAGLVTITRSIYPAMALHALIDIGSGLVTWTALRDPEPREETQVEGLTIEVAGIG
jgi:membrane protease YdiL (CAAX protease family)